MAIQYKQKGRLVSPPTESEQNLPYFNIFTLITWMALFSA